jgi:hypothetical protein
MAFIGTNVFLGGTLVGQTYLGDERIEYSPFEPQTLPYIRPDAYAAYIAYAQPMNYFSGSFGMTSFDSDIHAAIKGSGSNYKFPVSGSGTYVANGSKTAFSANGYNTSLKLAGDQNAGAWGPTTVPADLQMSNSDFVWEAYVNTDATIVGVGIWMMAGYGDTGNWSFNQTPAYIRYLVGPGDYFADSSTGLDKTADVWRHWAFVRSGNNFYCYWDGVKVVTFTQSLTLGTNNPVRLLGGGTSYSTSQIVQFQDFRIYKGTDKGYTGATITPPPSMVVNA